MICEAHVTVKQEQTELLKKLAELEGWKHSEIARDPVLGQDTFFYFTAHDPSADALKTRIDSLLIRLHAHGISPVREKIELVLHDIRYQPHHAGFSGVHRFDFSAKAAK